MNKYLLQRVQYANSTNVYSEIEAACHKFEEGRVNFYNKKGQLIKSYPSNLLIISKIKYKKVKNE
jgi:uncharacterized protein Veg